VAAQAVVRSLRVGDVPYRLGADQLAILLPATGVEDAVAVGTRLGKAVQEALSLSDLHPAAGTLRLLTTPVDVTGGVDGVLERAASALIEQGTATPAPAKPSRPAVTF
jgi:GGDEF domain-containing protein